jgi:hypothetical protein
MAILMLNIAADVAQLLSSEDAILKALHAAELGNRAPGFGAVRDGCRTICRRGQLW